MKFIAKILALYFLVVAFMPCKDGLQVCSSHCASHLVAQNDTTDHQEHQDACPPLCACACCGISSMISPDLISWEFMLPEPYAINAFTYTSPKGVFFYDNIWQPPKTS